MGFLYGYRPLISDFALIWLILVLTAEDWLQFHHRIIHFKTEVDDLYVYISHWNKRLFIIILDPFHSYLDYTTLLYLPVVDYQVQPRVLVVLYLIVIITDNKP